jgi:hypothetical protein
MKIILTDWCKAWRGAGPQPIRPAVLDLVQERHRMALIVALGNGTFDEACIEVDSSEARDWVRGAMTGTGGADRVEPTASAAACRLFRAGYEIYRQGQDAFFFLNPLPRAELFSSTMDLAVYAREFSARR